MTTMSTLFNKYREQILYIFFGGVTTVINIAAFALGRALGLPTAVANIIAWVLAVLAAYVTNRIWVFRSHSAGGALAREFLSFIGCRVATGVLDEAIVVLGVDVLGPAVAPGHAQLWGLGVKVFSNVLVILLNYVFSKLLIFRKKREE